MKLGPMAAALGIGLASAAQAQEARVTPTIPPPMPPPIRPAPPVTMADISEREAARQRIMPLEVRVFGGAEELWSRPLVLRGYNGAQVTLEVSEASTCQVDQESSYGSAQRTGLKLQINQRGTANRFQVTASWTRRSTDCSTPGTLSAGLEASLELAPGQTRTLSGDGGLRVVLTRPR